MIEVKVTELDKVKEILEIIRDMAVDNRVPINARLEYVSRIEKVLGRHL